MLKREGIHRQKKDVGGCSARKIILDVATGNIDVQESLQRAMEPVVEHDGILADKEVSYLIRQIERLKPDETEAGKLLEVIHHQGSSTQDIQEIISKDFALVCHIFRMCNSSYYGIPNKISSIPDAIRLLGKRQFRLICTVVGTMRHQENSLTDFGPLAENFKIHNNASALIARCLASRVSPDLKEDAYSAGLFHSVGKVGAILMSSKDGRNESLKDNSDLFAKGSNAIGEIILTKWNIPDKIMRAAVDFENPSEGTSDRHRLTAMVHVACGLSHLLGISFGKHICVAKISPIALAQIGLADGLEPLLPAIFEELRSVGLIQKVEINQGDHN